MFDNCRIPAGNLLGEEHKGFYALMKNLQNERIVLGAQAMGEASRALELTMEWVTQRNAFGSSLWDKQAIRQRLAMRASEVEAAKALVYNTAWRDAQGQQVTKEVLDDQGAVRHARQRGAVRLRAVPRRHGFTCARPRSNGYGAATRGCRRSAAARPR